LVSANINMNTRILH